MSHPWYTPTTQSDPTTAAQVARSILSMLLRQMRKIKRRRGIGRYSDARMSTNDASVISGEAWEIIKGACAKRGYELSCMWDEFCSEWDIDVSLPLPVEMACS